MYIYGSHDLYNGHVFCLGDYVCWSAPIDNLADWRYEGVIYSKCADPLNKEGKMCLYAPDVTVGPDGRYYLYYVLDHVSVVSVAVCDTPAEQPMAYGANNHGSIVEINGEWYIFYHRHTNGTWYSRQGCAEKICIDGDGDEEPGYISNMQNSATAGFKYFDCHGVKKITIKVRGYADGFFEVRTTWDGEVLAQIPVVNSNVWEAYSTSIDIPDGKQALYLTYCGNGNASLLSFELE